MRRLFVDSQDADVFGPDTNAAAWELRSLPLVEVGDAGVYSRRVDPAVLSYVADVYGSSPDILVTAKGGADLLEALERDRKTMKRIREMVSGGRWTVEPFVCSPRMVRFAKTIGCELNGEPLLWAEHASKSGFKHLAGMLGLPTPEWIQVELPRQSAVLRQFIAQNGECFVKRDMGAGGIGSVVLARDRLADASGLCRAGSYICEQKIDTWLEGSAHLVNRGGQLETYIAETTCDERYGYQGCTLPARQEVIEIVKDYVKAIANALSSVAPPRGYLGFDFAIDRSGRAVFLECNPRKTAVSYALEAVRRVVGGKAVQMCAQRFRTLGARYQSPRCVLDRLGSILVPFSGGTAGGVLLGNLGWVGLGEVELIAFGDEVTTRQLIETGRRLLE